MTVKRKHRQPKNFGRKVMNERRNKIKRRIERDKYRVSERKKMIDMWGEGREKEKGRRELVVEGLVVSSN